MNPDRTVIPNDILNFSLQISPYSPLSFFQDKKQPNSSRDTGNTQYVESLCDQDRSLPVPRAFLDWSRLGEKN